MNAGKTQVEIAEQLEISRSTFWRDVCRLTKDYSLDNREAFGQLRELQVGALMDMAKEVHEGDITPEAGNSIRGFLDSVSKLLGLNAPTKHVTAKVDATTDPSEMKLWQRAVYELRNIPEDRMDEFWERVRPVITEFAQPDVVVDESYYPPKKELPA